jgi:hypothetical protein
LSLVDDGYIYSEVGHTRHINHRVDTLVYCHSRRRCRNWSSLIYLVGFMLFARLHYRCRAYDEIQCVGLLSGNDRVPFGSGCDHDSIG